MIIGDGSYQYEWLEQWGQLPTGIQYGYTHGVVTDKNDNVYVHNQSKDSIVVFDKEGSFLQSWGAEFGAGAHGLYLSAENGTEYLYLSDNALHDVVKTTLEGEEIYRLGLPPRPDIYEHREQYVPTDAAVAPNGDVYVCDGYGMPWIHRYTKDAEYIQSWGGAGSELGQMLQPHGIWIDTRFDTPQVLVADRGNNRIQIFTLDGKHKAFVAHDLRMPCCFFEKGGDIFIPDLYSRVTLFDKEWNLIEQLGDTPDGWTLPGYPNIAHELRRVGHFTSPHGLCVDSQDDIYVTEWISDGRVTKLRRVR